MLPQNNYLSYQKLPQQSGQYTFDLKVNVDFDRRQVGMGQPHNVQLSPAFARKQEVPMLYSQPVHQVQPSPGSLYTAVPQAMVASYPPVNVFPPVANYAYNEEVYASAHQPYPSQRAQPTYYSPNAKARSGYQTHPETQQSFSMNIQRSLDAVNCVICDKPVNREHFQAHLEQHKERKREYGARDMKTNNETSKMASFSIRNQNSLENIGDIYRQPSRNTTSLEPRDKTFSRSIKQNTSQTLSKDIEESYSRIVYAPRDPSRIISGTPQSHSQSDFNYSHSSGFDNYGQGQGQGQGQQQVVTAQSNQRQSNLNRMNQSNESNWVQASFNQPSQSHPSYSVDTKGGYNPQNRGKTMEQSQRKSSHLMPSELSRQMEQERLKASRIDSSFQSQHNQSVNWGQAKKPSKVSINNSRNSSKLNTSNSGYFEYNQTKSRYLKPERRSMLEECDQSMIHHLKDFSRYSKDSNLGELNKQLRIQQIVEQSSSDDEDYSMRPSPSMRMASSIHPTTRTGRMDQTKMTNGLSRTKLPLNYLAVQEFIQNPMYYSCYRSSHQRV